MAVASAVPFRQVQEHREPLRLELTQSFRGRWKNDECALETTRKTVKKKSVPTTTFVPFQSFFFFFLYQKGKIVSVNLSLNVFTSVLGSLLAHFLTVFKCDDGLEASPLPFLTTVRSLQSRQINKALPYY